MSFTSETRHVERVKIPRRCPWCNESFEAHVEIAFLMRRAASGQRITQVGARRTPAEEHRCVDRRPVHPETTMNVFSEADIRTAMMDHHPANEGDCSCAWAVPSENIHQEFTVDHLIDVLRTR